MDAEEERLLTTPRFEIVRAARVRPDGSRRERYVIRHPGAVTILPLLDDGRVCLVRNYRLSVDATLLELPAGTREPREAPEVTARRELAEETGYHCRQLEKLHEFFLSPGVLDERMHLYLATGLTAGPPAPEEDEELETVLLPWDAALARIESGEIEDAKTLVGLLFYERMRARE